MAMRVVENDPDLFQPEPVPEPTPEAEAKPEVTHAQVLAVLNAIAAILAVRFLLLLALIGSFILTLGAMGSPSLPKIVILVVYNLFVVSPVAFLSRRA